MIGAHLVAPSNNSDTSNIQQSSSKATEQRQSIVKQQTLPTSKISGGPEKVAQ